MDAGITTIHYNYSGKKRENENQIVVPKMEQQGFRRQSINRLIWLDKEITTKNAPHNTKISLFGVFDVTTRHVMIYFIIDYEFTEYRILRLDKAISPIVRGEVDDLLYAHKNMVAHFMGSLIGKEFAVVVRQWLKWNKNPTYDKVFTSLLDRNQRKRT